MSFSTSLVIAIIACFTDLYFSGSLKMARIWFPSQEHTFLPSSSSVNGKVTTSQFLFRSQIISLIDLAMILARDSMT